MSETFIKEFHFSEEDMSICDELIEYHSNNTEYKWAGNTQGAKGGKKSTDVTIHPSSRNPVFLKYRQLLYGYLREYLNAYDNPLNKLRIAEGMNIQHYKPSEGFLGWHCERISQQVHQRALVFMTYLNDVHDGGGTDFKYQGKRQHARKGKTLIWPSDFTHTHRGEPSPTEEKYIATGWFSHIDVGVLNSLIHELL